jgi:hypothetical protein
MCAYCKISCMCTCSSYYLTVVQVARTTQHRTGTALLAPGPPAPLPRADSGLDQLHTPRHAALRLMALPGMAALRVLLAGIVFLATLLRPGAAVEAAAVAAVDGRRAVAETGEDFVCATLDWWPPDKCDYGNCAWGRASLLNLVGHDNLMKEFSRSFFLLVDPREHGGLTRGSVCLSLSLRISPTRSCSMPSKVGDAGLRSCFVVPD